MLKLYYGPGTCSLVAHIALRLSGERFDLHRVNLAKGEQHTDAYRAVSPHGMVPVLDFGDGRILTESTVIAAYIAETYPSANLLPTDRTQLFRNRELVTWANIALHATTFARLFRPARFTPDETVHAALKEAALSDLAQHLSFVDARIAERDWGAPDQTTIADLFLYVYSRWAERVGTDLSALPHLHALRQTIDALPATQAALEAEGLS